jgi:hypothetical protein
VSLCGLMAIKAPPLSLSMPDDASVKQQYTTLQKAMRLTYASSSP